MPSARYPVGQKNKLSEFIRYMKLTGIFPVAYESCFLNWERIHERREGKTELKLDKEPFT